ncbi:MAG: hypothetical protein ABSF09_12250 [Candidatus Bathyarchaeia archaeon]|jgi:hypothetical protein
MKEPLLRKGQPTLKGPIDQFVSKVGENDAKLQDATNDQKHTTTDNENAEAVVHIQFPGSQDVFELRGTVIKHEKSEVNLKKVTSHE